MVIMCSNIFVYKIMSSNRSLTFGSNGSNCSNENDYVIKNSITSKFNGSNGSNGCVYVVMK